MPKLELIPDLLDYSGLDSIEDNPQQDNQGSKKNDEIPEGLDFTGIDSVGRTSFSRPAKIPQSSSSKGGKVRSGYGYRKDPISGKSAFHDGIDLPTPIDTPIHPFGIGTVVFAGERGAYGKSVGIEYGNGITIYTNHLNKIKSQLGDMVRPETLIGLSGNTGKSTGPHVHIQVIKDGTSINPLRIFANDPRIDGLNLTLRDIISDDESISDNVSNVSPIPEGLDFTGVDDVAIPQDVEQLDFIGIDQVTENTTLNQNNQIDTDIVKFDAKTQEDVRKEQENLPLLAKMAKGIASTNDKPIKPRVENPYRAGKPFTLIVKTVNGKPPTLKDIIKADISHLGITELNERFKKDFKAISGIDDADIIENLPSRYSKNSDGSYSVFMKNGHTSDIIDLINAYSRGGLEAFAAKQEELRKQAELYKADVEEQKARPKALIENHPYLSAVIEGATGGHGQSIKHGLQEVALGEIQLMHSLSMLPEAFYTSIVHGFDSKEYTELIRRDAQTQIPISEALAGIPEEKDLVGKIVKGGTVAIGTLPRFMAAGQLGSFTVPTMVFVENLHKGSRDALLAALPMAVMMGSMHGMETFIGEGGNPLDVFKRSSIANDELINSIASRFPYDPAKFGNQLYMVAETKGIPLKVLDFNPITPVQRQLVMRGTNGLLNLGVSAATNPHFSTQEGITSLVIGLGLPVGKGRIGESGRFERPSTITGDAYTLPDGSVLLQALISRESGLIQGRIPNEPPPRYNPIEDLTPFPPSPRRLLSRGGTIEVKLGEEGTYSEGVTKYPTKEIMTSRRSISVEGNTSDYKRGSFWGQGRISIQQEPTAKRVGRAALLDIDTAALNLLDLKRALENKEYISDDKTITNMAQRTARELVRKSDLESAIRILDSAIPPETQTFFEQNEKIIREAIKTNYESRLKKEEFIKGQKILRKPDSQLSTEDVRPFSPTSGKSATDNFMQRARRTMISVEEAGRKGLEANKKNKGTFNASIAGIDPSDIPYYVQIGIGKLGRKGLDAAEFIREMAAEHGEDFKRYGMEVYKQAKDFVDGVNNLADFVSSKYISSKGDLKQPPFPIADMATIKNVFYLGSKYLKEAKEEDIPLNKVIATQKGVRTESLLKFGEDPYIALLEGRTDIVGNPEVPKAVKINDTYYLFDGHHRSSAKKLTGELTIRGRVIDLNEVATSQDAITPRAERAKEVFGETGAQNKFFTQEKQLDVRENLFKPPSKNALQEGITGTTKWFYQQSSNLVQISGFYIEDFYRKGIEPTLNKFLDRFTNDFGDWIMRLPYEKLEQIYEAGKNYYQIKQEQAADEWAARYNRNADRVRVDNVDGKFKVAQYNKDFKGEEYFAGYLDDRTYTNHKDAEQAADRAWNRYFTQDTGEIEVRDGDVREIEGILNTSSFGNRLLTREVFDRSKNSLLKSLQDETGNSETSSGTIFNSGLNPEAFLDQIKLLYKGVQDFHLFYSSLTRKYGAKIEPYIQDIWDWIKSSTINFHQDERGFFNFGKKKKLYKGDELDVFESNRPSLTSRISYKIHRGIALAQTYEPFGQVYQTLRGLQRTTNAYSTTILEQLTRSVSLLKEDKNQNVAQAILARNKEQVQDAAEDARIIARFGLNSEQTQAYNYIRAAVSNVLDLRRDTLLYREYRGVDKINQDLIDKGWPTGGTPINPQHAELLTKLADANDKIQKIEDYYQGLKDSGYLSLQRLGRFRAELENPAFPIDDPNHYLIDYTDTAEKAQRRINEWKGQHGIAGTGKILDAHKPGDFRELSRNLTPGDFEELVAGAGVTNTKEVEAIRAEVYEKYPSMGYQLKRKFYPGYPETNEFVIKSITHQAEVYSSSYYNNLGREEGLRSLEATGLDKSDPDLWNVARQYIEDETSTPRYTLADRAAFKARKFTYMMQLAYDVKQLYLNMFVQPITQNYSYLARVENPTSGKRLGGVAEVEKVFVKGTKFALKLAKESIGSKSLSNPEFNEFRDVYNRLKLERVIEPEFTKSLLELEAEKVSDVDNAFRSRTRKFFSRRQQEHWAGAFMRAGEVGTRTQMAASLFLAAKRFGLSGESLVDFIVKGVDATQTNPTRGENPYIVRQAGEVGKLFYQFGAFRHMWFENLILNAKSDWAHKSIAATSRTLAPLAIVAGIGGLPLSGFAFTLYALVTGKDPNKDLKKWIKRRIADNNYLENAALYGFTGNASFSQAAGITTPVLDTAADQLTQDQWLDKIFSSNVPALLTVKQIATGLTTLSSGVYHKKPSEVLRAIEQGFPLKPIRQTARTIRASEEGYRTSTGHVIYGKKKITIPEKFLQVLGTTPNKVVEEYDERKYKKLRRSPIGKATRRTFKRLTQ